MTVDQLIFAGKMKKNTARVYFLWGKQKALITKSRRTHPLHKISSKNPDFEAIYHFRVDSYHTLPWCQTFFLIFLFFAKRRRWVVTRVHRFVALSQLSHEEKNQGKPLWPGYPHISRRKIYSLILQLQHVKISAKSNKTTSNKICF